MSNSLEYYLTYYNDMGWDNWTPCYVNKLVNLLAWAFDQGADLIIDIKVSTTTISQFNVVYFRWLSTYFRVVLYPSLNKLNFQLGQDFETPQYSYNQSKAIRLRFNHTDNSIDIIQTGEPTQHIQWTYPSDTSPFTYIEGTTQIWGPAYGWLEYLKIGVQ